LTFKFVMITEVFKMPKGKLHKPLALVAAKRYSSGNSVALKSLPNPTLTELNTDCHTYTRTWAQRACLKA
jgi:hypothetical protein